MSIKVNDVIDVFVSIELVGVPEDLHTIDESDYKRKYHISYFLGDRCIAGTDFEVDAGYIIDDDIEDLMSDEIPSTFEEIAKYEVFDVNTRDYEYRKAKIRVKEIK